MIKKKKNRLKAVLIIICTHLTMALCNKLEIFGPDSLFDNIKIIVKDEQPVKFERDNKNKKILLSGGNADSSETLLEKEVYIFLKENIKKVLNTRGIPSCMDGLEFDVAIKLYYQNTKRIDIVFICENYREGYLRLFRNEIEINRYYLIKFNKKFTRYIRKISSELKKKLFTK